MKKIIELTDKNEIDFHHNHHTTNNHKGFGFFLTVPMETSLPTPILSVLINLVLQNLSLQVLFSLFPPFPPSLFFSFSHLFEKKDFLVSVTSSVNGVPYTDALNPRFFFLFLSFSLSEYFPLIPVFLFLISSLQRNSSKPMGM